MAGDEHSFALVSLSSVLIIVSPLHATRISVALTPVATGIVPVMVVLTYYMMRNADYILSRIGQRELRAINCLMGMLLIAIAVGFVINDIRPAFPVLTGG